MFDLNYKGFEDYLLWKRPCCDGFEYLFGFGNGYGAILTRRTDKMFNEYEDKFEYNLYGLDVLEFPDWEKDPYYYEFNADNDITGGDSVECSDINKIRELLKKIKELPNRW